MTRFAWLTLAAALLLAACASPGGGDPCAVERLAELPLSTAELLPRVAVQVNGKPALMLVDTGAGGTILTAEAARRLGADAAPDMRIQATAVGGYSSHRAVILRSLALGPVTLTDLVAAELSFTLPNFGDPPIDGILGADVLNRYDVEIDGPGNRMTLYRARFCPAGRLPWTEPHTALRRPSAPGQPRYNVIGVRVDGQEVAAVIDTGSNVTAVDVHVARRLGVTAAALAHEQGSEVLGVASAPGRMWRHTFRSIDIAGERHTRPQLAIIDLANSADMLIGQDFLGARRMWLSFGSDTVYVTHPPPRSAP